MADITTAQAGNWSSTSTWTGGVVPGDGDNAFINHAVTVDVNTTIGTSPAEGAIADHLTDERAIVATDDLTIADDVQLTVRGNATFSQCNLLTEGGGGSIWEFDASQATDPTNQNYYCLISIDWGGNSWVEFTGISSNRCTVRSNASGGNGYFSTWSDPVGFYATRGGTWRNTAYVDFLRIGTASIPGFGVSPAGGSSWNVQNCTYTDCGDIQNHDTLDADYPFVHDNNNHIDSLGTYGFNSSIDNTRNETRSMQDCVFDTQIQVHSPFEMDFTGTLFLEGWTGTTNQKCIELQDCLIRRTARGSLGAIGDIGACYILKDGDMSNPHFIGYGNYSSDFDGAIFDMIGTITADTGDGIINGTLAGTWNITNCINLRPDVTFFTAVATHASQEVNIEHNTWRHQINVNETAQTDAGLIASLRSNIAFRDTSSSDFLINDTDGDADDDVADPDFTDYNATYNKAAGESGNGINIPMSTTHSANSIDADPQFVDATRNIETWDDSLGGPGTVANAITELAKLNLSDHDSNYTVANLVAYVKAGFAPTNASYDGAAHDAGTIGAVAYQIASTGNARRLINGGLVNAGPVNTGLM